MDTLSIWQAQIYATATAAAAAATATNDASKTIGQLLQSQTLAVSQLAFDLSGSKAPTLVRLVGLARQQCDILVARNESKSSG